MIQWLWRQHKAGGRLNLIALAVERYLASASVPVDALAAAARHLAYTCSGSSTRTIATTVAEPIAMLALGGGSLSRFFHWTLVPIALMWTMMMVVVILPPQDTRPGLEATLVSGSLVVGAISGLILVSLLRRVKSKLTKAFSLFGYLGSVLPAFGLAGQGLEAFDFLKGGNLPIATVNFAFTATIPLTVGTLAGLFVGVILNGIISLGRGIRRG